MKTKKVIQIKEYQYNKDGKLEKEITTVIEEIDPKDEKK